MEDFDRILTQSKTVLERNDRGAYTVPSNELFPHQWLWDSCFVAIAYSHTSPERGAQELRSLMRGQWANGMVPNQIVSPGARYMPERANFRSQVNPNSPRTVTTSGFSQPPVIAEATWRVGQNLETGAQQDFLQEMFPKLVAYHEFLFRERQLNDDGIVSIIHPYESGMDNTPALLQPIREHFGIASEGPRNYLDRVVFHGLNRVRRDLRSVEASQRMHNVDVMAYQILTKRIRGHGYDSARILRDPNIPAIEDVAYNAIFMHANTKLQFIAEAIGEEIPEDLQIQIKRQREGFEEFWNEEVGAYTNRNARTGQHIPIETVTSLLSLYGYSESGEPDPHEQEVVQSLIDPQKFWTEHPIPSVPLDSDHFDEKRYWAGPGWSWMNWLIEQGVRDHGHTGEANRIRHITALTARSEYHHPITGEPLGIGYFAGAAAIAIDSIKRIQAEAVY